MKRHLFSVLLATGIVAAGTATIAQQVPGRGFTALLCVAERLGSGPQSPQVGVVVVSDTGSSAVVTIFHGTTSSTHAVLYDDANESGRLDCGDVIFSVT